ncbi:deoxyhypusine synthase family protein [Candidatus Woesearchaeota archaeon]|nr:deoxyhypusine synthase family protein [Candidatus Woesearchaeota archaeon]MBI2661665.1 deoxyhypusine synthase family protein [Candidatus Woesearchaeota archaeon]
MENKCEHNNNLRNKEEFGDGFSDNLVPLTPLDLSECNDFDELLRAMSFTAFDGRRLGEAADVLYRMSTDKDCFVVLTLSGAMTMAKMGMIVCDLIERNMVHAVISTGALMAHGFVEGTKRLHFKHDSKFNDSELHKKGYNRVYDTIELEKNLDDVELIMKLVLSHHDPNETLCSYKTNNILGKYLHNSVKGRAILKSAYEKKIPVYVPAFTDSELGLNFGLDRRRRIAAGKPILKFDPFLDLEHYTGLMQKQKKVAIFTIGGGVPRNWAQQVGPYLELLKRRENGKKYLDEEPRPCRFSYGVRLCPEPVHFGGLSGCTYSEGVSWGKFLDPAEGGRYAEVMTDATLALPVLVKAVMQRLDKNNVRIEKALECFS